MDPVLKVKWIEALRSGEYRQARRALRRGNKFCCLGVLCELMGATWDDGDTDRNASINGERQDYYLSPTALATTGMPERQQEILYTMNDDDGKSFKQIADYIEQNL